MQKTAFNYKLSFCLNTQLQSLNERPSYITFLAYLLKSPEVSRWNVKLFTFS